MGDTGYLTIKKKIRYFLRKVMKQDFGIWKGIDYPKEPKRITYDLYFKVVHETYFSP